MKLAKRVSFKCFHNVDKKVVCGIMGMVINLIGVINSRGILIPKHCFVYLIYIHNFYWSIIPQ